MASKLIVFAVALAACNANPIWLTGYVPNVVYRQGRAPAIAYGFGNGYSAKIAGVHQSSSFGASINSGEGEAYGAGYASNDGSVQAKGIGYVSPSPPAYPPVSSYSPAVYPPVNVYSPAVYPSVRYYNPYGANYGQAASSAQSNGYGSAQAQAQNQGYGAAPAHNYGRYQNLRRNGYSGIASAGQNGYNGIASATNHGDGTATASSSSNPYGGSSVSTTQSRDAYGGYQTSIAASEQDGLYHASSAQTVQQNGRGSINTSATSIEGPGIEATHSHSIKTGHY